MNHKTAGVSAIALAAALGGFVALQHSKVEAAPRPICFNQFVIPGDGFFPPEFVMQFSNVPPGRTFRLQVSEDLKTWSDAAPKDEFTGISDLNAVWQPGVRFIEGPPPAPDGETNFPPQHVSRYYRAVDVTP